MAKLKLTKLTLIAAYCALAMPGIFREHFPHFPWTPMRGKSFKQVVHSVIVQADNKRKTERQVFQVEVSEEKKNIQVVDLHFGTNFFFFFFWQ